MTQATSRPYQPRVQKQTSRNYKLYASVAAPQNLVTDSGVNESCVRILVITAGTLVVRPVGGPADGSRDVSFPALPANTLLPIEAIMLVSGTATNILVMW
jgi:hypothetical protein